MQVTRVLAGSVALVAAFAEIAVAQSADRARPYDSRQRAAEAPAVDLWLDRLDFDFGDPIRPFFASEPGAYVTVVRVTTDGEIRVLYPRRPLEQRALPTGSLANERVPYAEDRDFRLYESSGTGFVFAIASYDRFDFRSYTSGSQWSVARLASSRYGDPFRIVDQFISRTLSTRSQFSIDYMSYEVSGNSRGRTRYANNYRFYTHDDYYQSCLSSFALRYDYYYCDGYDGFRDGYYGRSAYYGGHFGRGYGPVVGSRPQNPVRPANPKPRMGLRPRPLTPDPIAPDPRFPDAPLPSPAVGRFGDNGRGEDALMRSAARREQEMRRERPSIRDIPRDGGQPSARAGSPRMMDREPRIEPREQPRYEPPVQTRAEPRYDPPMQTRAEPRVERVETRSEPRVETQSEPRAGSRPPPARAAPQRIDPPGERQ